MANFFYHISCLQFTAYLLTWSCSVTSNPTNRQLDHHEGQPLYAISTIQAVVVSRKAGEIRNAVEVVIKSLLKATNRTICDVTN